MANRFQKFNPDGGNIGLWADPEHEILRLGLGTCTAYLYNDAGALKLSTGRVGLNDGSQEGAVILDTVTSISLVGLTVSCWARVEVSRTFTTPVLEITSIGGATDPAALPAGFTGAYDGNKQGFYVTATRRCVGLAWLNAAGTLEGVVNCLHGHAYAGYSQSNDALDTPYFFGYHASTDLDAALNRRSLPQVKTAAFTATPLESDLTFFPVVTGASSFNATVPAAADNYGKRINIYKRDTGAGVVTAIPTGAETFNGATALPMRLRGDCIELWSDGAMWRVIDSMSTLDSAALNTAAPIITAHGLGVQPRKCIWAMVCTSADANHAANDEIVFNPSYEEASGNNQMIGIEKDSTNIIWHNDASARFLIPDKTTSVVGAADESKWKARYRLSI